jgi:hypothetical protein
MDRRLEDPIAHRDCQHWNANTNEGLFMKITLLVVVIFLTLLTGATAHVPCRLWPALKKLWR